MTDAAQGDHKVTERISYQRAIATAIAMVPHGCMAEAHRTSVCDNCTETLAALRALAARFEQIEAQLPPMPDGVRLNYLDALDFAAFCAAGFDPSTNTPASGEKIDDGKQ